MTLREFLDQVRFGAVGSLCIAICGEEEYLDNFEDGQYWELECGNWHDGSKSPTTPELPEELMDARVTQVECRSNPQHFYANIDRLGNDNHHYTVIMIEAPYGFDAEKYWTEDNMHESVFCPWHYAISEKKWKEIQRMDSNWRLVSMAIASIPYFGLNQICEYEEEDFAEMDADDETILRLAQRIAQKIQHLNELCALLQLTGSFSAFLKNF